MNASVKLIEQVIPSTVGISVTVPQQHPSASILGTERMGSGALIDPAGYILTVNYVVIGAATVRVSLLDNNQHDAEVAAQDFASGIAVLKITSSGFPVVPLRSATDLHPGDEVFLVASSGEDNTRRVNGGILTSVSPFDAYWEYGLDRALLCSAMNPGLGGGPMFDMKGRMVGVPVRLSETPGAVRTPSPMLGEHTEDVLRGLLGMGAEEIAALKASGAIR